MTSRTFLFVLALVFSANSSAIEINNSNASSIAEAYGFVIGQQLTLDRIAKRYPDLSREVLLARLSFQRTFGDIPAEVEPMLREAFGDENYQKFRAKIKDQLKRQLGAQNLNLQASKAFLGEVNTRAKGDIPEPILAYLLAIRFGDVPVKEYVKGFRQKYKTDGYGKSNGVVLHMQLPRSWQGLEGNRPHIVRKWKSEAGTGMELIMLQVRETDGVRVTRSDVAEMMQPGEIEDLVPEGGLLRDYGMVTIENLPGYFMDIELLMERAGIAIYQKMRQYSFFYHDRMVAVQCSAGAPESEHEVVGARFERMKPLCAQIFNSVVLPGEYEGMEPKNWPKEEVTMPAI